MKQVKDYLFLNSLGLLCFLLIITFLSGANSCSIAQNTGKEKLPFGTWFRSQEEDLDPASGWQKYRPSDYPFPPARGRSGYILKKDGSFAILKPSPLDGRDTLWGRWKFSSTDRLMLEIPSSGITQFRWKKIGVGLLEVEMK